MLIRDAEAVWNNLKGIICVYKPAELKCSQVRKLIINKMCTDLNEMECRPPVDYVSIEGNPAEKLTVTRQPSLADDPLVIGPRYQVDDLKCSWSSYLGPNTSGILLLGIRDGTKIAKHIRENRLTRAYKIKGAFGQATENYFKDGKVVERTKFNHIKSIYIEKLLASMQTSHQQKMFELCGVDMQSQAAFELAAQGPIRPANSKIPLIYGIRCTHFDSPNFTIEIQCINEYEGYLKTLIHEIGIQLHSSAYCTGIQCIRHSYFTLDHALLRKHWTLQNIITNMENCSTIMKEHDDIKFQKSAVLQ